MPKQTRWTIKRSLDQANKALDKAQNYLVKEGIRYKGVHDDYFEKFSKIVQAIELVKLSVQKLRDSI